MKKIIIFLMLSFVIIFTGCNKAKKEEAIKKYNVEVIENYNNSVSLTGGSIKQNIDIASEFKNIKIKEKYGYKYLYYEIDNVKYYDTTIKLDYIDKDTKIEIFSERSLFDLPIVEIKTDDKITNKYDYVKMNFSLTNIDSPLLDLEGQIKLRGNTTKSLEKKPYAIKFDKKQSLFGLEKAKSYVLLADYLDPTSMHNWCALTLGNKFDELEFTPTPNKVNLYLNDRYDGIYTLCEKVQENKGRLNIEEDLKGKEFTTIFDYNFLFEMEESVVYDFDSKEDETYFYIEKYDQYIELKYPEKDSFDNEEDYFKFFNEFKEYITLVFDKVNNNDLDFINENLNMKSLIDYLLVDLTMGEADHKYRSFYMYYKKDNKKINFGPIWDYDYCLYVPWTWMPNRYYKVSDELKYMNEFFRLIENNDVYFDELKLRYKNVGRNNILEMIREYKDYKSAIDESLRTNSLRWYKETKIYDKNTQFLLDFLNNRIEVFDKEFSFN